MARGPGTKITARELIALRKNTVPVGAVLNPYGRLGYYKRKEKEISKFPPSYREAAMKRTRLKLDVKKAVALERHELQQLARENATAAMQTLIEITKNKRAPEATRIAASSVILDRGYGKASQTSISASVTNGNVKEITGNELNKRIEAALKRVEAATTGTPKAGKSANRLTHVRILN
jgi:hypothetical protein